MAISAGTPGWGLYCTCSGGTAASQTIVAAGIPTAISAIVIGGAATTDIITIADAGGNILLKGAAASPGQAATTTFGNNPPRIDGVVVSMAGATTGWCSIVYATR